MNELIKALNQKSIDHCFAGLQREDTPLALATVVQAISPTSGKAGDKALISPDAIVEGWIGGGCAQPAVIEAARSSIESGQSKLIRVGPKGEWEPLAGVEDFASGCLSGGTLLIFVEPMIRQPVLSILGNSPAALSLSRLAGELGFAVTVAYPEPLSSDAADNVQLLDNFDGIDGEYVVIATQGKYDRDAMKSALKTPARHIAMIASAKKIAGLKASLAKAGIDASELERIHSPAGIEIGAKTPAEIALSVLADLVRVRRGIEIVKDGAKSVEPEAQAEAVSSDSGGGCCGG